MEQRGRDQRFLAYGARYPACPRSSRAPDTLGEHGSSLPCFAQGLGRSPVSPRRGFSFGRLIHLKVQFAVPTYPYLGIRGDNDPGGSNRTMGAMIAPIGGASPQISDDGGTLARTGRFRGIGALPLERGRNCVTY